MAGPKKKFSREGIIEAGFEIASVYGFDGITVQKIAKKIGASVSPVYVNFTDVEELIQAVVQKVYDVSRDMLADVDTGQPFYDMGVASLRFAKEYPVLFRDMLFQTKNHLENYEEEMEKQLLDQMKKDTALEALSEEGLKRLLLKMRMFQVGLSTMISNGSFPASFTEEDAILLLNEIGEEMIDAEHRRENHSRRQLP